MQLKKNNIMIDLETLGNTHDAPIIQIGACHFNSEGITDALDVTIDFDSAMKYGKASGSTIKWWLGQSQEARDSVTAKGSVDLPDALEYLAKWISKFNRLDEGFADIWCHSSFDAPILANAYAATDKLLPYKYWQVNDMRTVDNLFGPALGIKRTGAHHTAMADAMYQAECLIKTIAMIQVVRD